MAWIACLLSLSLLSHSILLTKCDQVEDVLLSEIMAYRASRNLTALNTSEGADCVAEEIVETYKNQSCINPNTTAANFSKYPAPLAKCGLNATAADGLILPACVVSASTSASSSASISNFISIYASYLNSSLFSVVGVASQDNWAVVVLTNTTAGGSNGASAITPITTALMFSIIICFFASFMLV